MKTSEAKYREIRPVIESGQPEEAINQLHQLLDTHPDCAQGHSDLAALYHRNGDRDRAVHHYREAVRLDPENAATRKDLANYLYAELGETAEAFLHFRRVLELDPQEVETLLICGNLCVVEHRFEDARACYRKVLDIEPWNSDAYTCIERLEKLGDTISGGQVEDRYQDILTAGRDGDVGRTMAELKTLVEDYPDFAIAYNDLGVLHYNSGHKKDARGYYETAVRLQPENITFQKNLADFLLVEEGCIQEALEIYLKVLSAKPNDAETLTAAGHICRSLHRNDDARVFYGRVLEIEPWNSEVLRLLEEMK